MSKTLPVLILLLSGLLFGQTRTRIVDTVNNPSTGTPAVTGTIILELSSACTAPGGFLAAGRTTVPISSSGGIDVQLIPNDTCVPANTTYRATYRLDNGASTYVQTWYVPTSGSNLAISAVAITPPPLPNIQIPISQLTGCPVNQTLISNGASFICAIPLINPMTALGDVTYGASGGTPTRLSGNTTATRKFLRQVGNGTISAAPAWDTLTSGDLPSIPGLSSLSTLNRVPKVTASGVLGETGVQCTTSDPNTCEMSAGASQGGTPFLRFRNNAGVSLSLVGADGGFTTYSGTTIKTAQTQGTLQMASDAYLAWKAVTDLVSPDPFDLHFRRYGSQKRLYIYDSVANTDLFHFNGENLSIGLGNPTSAFPMLKRSGTALQARLGDDSGYGDLQARDLTAFANLFLPLKTDPGSPVNGELWINGAAMKYRAGGATYPVATLDGTGRLAASQIPFTVVDTVSDMSMASSSHINQGVASWTPPIRTFATGTGFTQLPAAGAGNTNRVYMVLDANVTGGKCVTGGSLITWCRSNGTDYDALSGSGAGGGGEANTASNLGTGAAFFSSKVGVDLRFRSLTAASNKLSVTQSTNTLDVDVVPGNILFTALGSWPAAVTATHVSHLQSVTSDIQIQLNGKASATHNHLLTTLLDVNAIRGNTTRVQMANATVPNSGDCAVYDANGNLGPSGLPCIGTTNLRFAATATSNTIVHGIPSINVLVKCYTGAAGDTEVTPINTDPHTAGTVIVTFARADSNRSCVINGSGGVPVEKTKTFTSATTWTITQAEHGFTNANFEISVKLDTGTKYQVITSLCEIDKTTFDATCVFAVAKTGVMRVFTGGGGGNGGGGGGGTGDLTDVIAGTAIAVTNPTGPAPTVNLNLTPQTCSGTQKFSSVTAGGTFTCSADDTGPGGGGSPGGNNGDVQIKSGTSFAGIPCGDGISCSTELKVNTTVPAFLTNSATIDFGTINNTCTELTMALTGAGTNESVDPGWPTDLQVNAAAYMRVSAPGVVTIRLCNLNSSVTVGSKIFRASITRSR